MALTNFPNGITSMGVPIIGSGPSIPVTQGNYWWVNSATGNTGGPGTIDQPYSTLASLYTNSSIAANDVVIIAEGHTETISAAAGIALSVVGVQIVGLGTGGKRPTFTWSTLTTATVTIAGASTSWINCIGVCNIDQLVTAMSITGAGVTLGTTAYPFEWQDSATNKEALVCVTATGANLRSALIYKGQTGGSHCTAAFSLNGVAGAVLNCDLYGKASTAWVNFVTTACTNVEVYGYMYNSGTTNYTKDVVDTITGSTWFANFYDGAAGFGISGGSGSALGPAAAATVIADLAVPTADVTTNVYERDVIGNKTDTGVTVVGTTKSIEAYAKGLITMNTVQSADSTANAFSGDVTGNKTDTAVYASGTTKSIAAYVKGLTDSGEKFAVSAAVALTTPVTIFTIAGGPIMVSYLFGICTTTNSATASTIQFNSVPTIGSATTLSAASASTANAAAGASVTLAGTALATAALYAANGPNLIANPYTVLVPAGTITAIIGTGNNTGTWTFYIRYCPMKTGVTVS